MAKKKKKSTILRLFLALAIGLFVLEVMIEASTGTNLIGGRNGIFIRYSASTDKIVNSPMKANVRVLQKSSIYDQASLQAQKVGKLEVGDKLRIIGKTTLNRQDIWYQVQRYGGKTGYVLGYVVAQ